MQRENQSLKGDLSAMETVNNKQKNELNAEHCKVKLLEYEIEFLLKVSDANKKLIIDMLDQKQFEFVSQNTQTR